jgi:DNA-directed RNA polymerase subunit alpha
MLWRGFQKPKRLAVDAETLTGTYGKFSAQPFERGFGTTIGNALRRTLLSSIEGAAVTAIRIEGVLHEFQSITGVVEDATDIILNLKQVPFKLAGEGPKALYLRADQPGVVTSGMIEADGDVEILDKNIYIATVSEGGKLDMEMRLKRGRGYISADKNFDADLGIGFIPVDSVHSPVRRVNYVVEAARLGQITDYDKLTLEVWTNGAVNPADGVGLAAKLLKDHMNIFINFEEEIEAEARGEEGRVLLRNDNLNRSVEELQLPEERQHPDHWRTGAEDRSRDAQDQELWPQELERDQGNPRPDGSLAGNEDRRERQCGPRTYQHSSRRRPGCQLRPLRRRGRAAGLRRPAAAYRNREFLIAGTEGLRD